MDNKAQKKQQMVQYMRQVALQENQKSQQIDFGESLDKDGKKRVLVIMPESIGDIFIVTSLFESIRARYPREEWNFYFACKPEYFEIVDGNPFLDYTIAYIPQMDNHLWLTGQGSHNGYFEVVYMPYVLSQRFIGYVNNGVDKQGLELV